MTQLRRAVFLDRDGTLNIDRGYLIEPAQMCLLPGVAAALNELRAAGFVCVVVTNQSAVGRGMMSDADLQCIHAEMARQLAESGAVLDAIYAATALVDHPDRKPEPGMLLRAASDLQLDLANSWMIGDSVRDMLAGQRAGCKGCILVRTGHPIEDVAAACHVADDLTAAVRHIIDAL